MGLILSHEYLHAVARDILAACGVPLPEAETVAEVLVSANLMGLDSHGVIRVPQYVRAIQKGHIVPGAPIVPIQETLTTALIDAGWNLGPVGAKRATEVAIAKAQANHIASVVVRHCHHVGRLGAYPQMAAERGLVALAMCSSLGDGHWIPPWGGREGRLATNPLSFAAPTGGYPILLDMSTAVVSEGKLRVKHARGEPLPEGWILDAQGRPSTSTQDFYGPPMGVILPLGGKEGYKGYFLSFMVETLSRVLVGEKYPPGMPGAAGNGLWLMVLDAQAFMPLAEFRREMDELVAYMKSSSLAEGSSEVTVPGELDFRTAERRRAQGIPLEERTWQQIEQLAHELGVPLTGDPHIRQSA